MDAVQVQESTKTLSRGGKVALIAGASVLTLGLVYGVIVIVKHAKAKRGDSKEETSSEAK